MWPRFRVRQCARGYASVTIVTGFAELSLYNNSVGPYMLAVRDWINNPLGNPPGTIGVVSHGSFGTFAMNGVSSVTGEAVAAGQVFTNNPVAVPAADYLADSSSLDAPPWVHDYPFVILLPGWSFRLVCTDATILTVGGSFFWQWVKAEDIDGSLADLELKLAGA